MTGDSKRHMPEKLRGAESCGGRCPAGRPPLDADAAAAGGEEHDEEPAEPAKEPAEPADEAAEAAAGDALTAPGLPDLLREGGLL